MTKLPLLLNAVPKVNLVGPKVFLGPGRWTIVSNVWPLMFNIWHNSTFQEAAQTKTEQGYEINGGCIVQIELMETKDQRISIYAEKY